MSNQFPVLCAFGRFLLRFLCFLRRLFFSRKSLVVYACLATLGVLVWYGELWLARRGWEQEKKRIAAAGESLDPVKLLPPLPPEEDNFFAISELAPLRMEEGAGSDDGTKRLRMWFAVPVVTKAGPTGGARGKMHLPSLIQPHTPLSEVCKVFREAGLLPQVPLDEDPARELLKSAEQWQPLIDALVKGLDRRSALPLPSLHSASLWGRTASYGAWMPLLRSLQLYERAAYESGDQETASQVARVFNKIAEGFWNDGPLIAVIVASTLESMQASSCVAGMKDHRWAADWLAFVEESANEDRARAAIRRSFAMERTGYEMLLQKASQEGRKVIALTHIEKSQSPPWFERAYWNYFPEASARRWITRQSRGISELLAADLSFVQGSPAFQQLQQQAEKRGDGSASYLSLVPTILIQPRLFKTAIALERYYLTHQHYPVSLDDIADTLEPRTLMDADGQRLRYRTTADRQRFTIWSAGRDGIDDLAAGTAKNKRDDRILSTEEPAP